MLSKVAPSELIAIVLDWSSPIVFAHGRPTYPQLYIDGDLVGGLDIVQEMHDAGELAALGRS